MYKLIEYIKKPELIWLGMANHGLFNWMSDERFLSIKFRMIFHRKLNLDNPITFNEKIQWLKLYDRKPEYVTMVDKYAVKDYVRNIIGDKYIIPTFGVWNHFDEINFDELPNEFVLKCTHDSGGIVIVRDKRKLDKKAARKKLEKSLKKNFYYIGREWPYKNVQPRIIAEKYIEDPGRVVPEDFKVYCINGFPRYIVVFHNRFDALKPNSETVYDTNWIPQHISLDNHFLISNEIIDKPACLDELLHISKQLCNSFDQVRIDFYIIENKIYFGEITISTASGFQPMIPEEIDRFLGEELKLTKISEEYKNNDFVQNSQ